MSDLQLFRDLLEQALSIVQTETPVIQGFDSLENRIEVYLWDGSTVTITLTSDEEE